MSGVKTASRSEFLVTPSNSALAVPLTIYNNTAQEVIIITADKVKLCLTDNWRLIEQQYDWHTPLGIGLALLLTLLTTSFRDVYGLSKETWQALCVLGLGACVVWLLISCARRPRRPTVEDIVAEMKKNAETKA
jgi:hypothetical protein